MTMPFFNHYTVVLMISSLYTDGVFGSKLHKQEYYRHASSEEDLNISFKTSNAQYYNSREAHGDIIDVVDGTNVTEHYYTNSNENSNEENPGSISTALEGYINKSGVDTYPYSLRIGSQDAYGMSKADQDSVQISLDISDYLEALSDKKVAANKYIGSSNTRKNYGHAQSGVIFAEHSYSVPLSNSHLLDIDSMESKEDLASNVNTKSIYEQIFSTEIKDVSSQESFRIYSSNPVPVKYGDSTSAESSETIKPWTLLTEGQTRIRPGVPQDFDTTEVSLPQCSGSKNENKQTRCRKEQNLCRSTGDCRIARIWGTCCNSPSCGSYCKPNRSNCPHPNKLKEACQIESDEICNLLKNDCPRNKNCCQTPCGFKCV